MAEFSVDLDPHLTEEQVEMVRKQIQVLDGVLEVKEID